MRDLLRGEAITQLVNRLLLGVLEFSPLGALLLGVAFLPEPFASPSLFLLFACRRKKKLGTPAGQ